MSTDAAASAAAAGRSLPTFIRDPIHDIVRIDERFVLDLIDSRAVQRLRRIHQLGLAWLVYPGAEHSRFTHSLGVYHLAKRVMDQLSQEAGSDLFDGGKREAVLAAALLHDVGHGPFSHTFEDLARDVTGGARVSHESWTLRVIQEDPQVRAALEGACDPRGQPIPDLADAVCRIVDHTYQPHYVAALISSQLDVDRFDYLLRDSHMTGARYGSFDLEWMLRTLAVRPVDGTGGPGGLVGMRETIVIDGRRGLSGLEAHLLGRHYMYQHVYHHKTIRAADLLLQAVFRRAGERLREGAGLPCSPAFRKLARAEALTVNEYLSLDDYLLLSWVEQWAGSSTAGTFGTAGTPGAVDTVGTVGTAGDPILADLARRLVHRDLLKAITVPPALDAGRRAEASATLRQLVQDAGFDPAYYLLEDTVESTAYKDYLQSVGGGSVVAGDDEIWYLDGAGQTHRLSTSAESVLIKAGDALRYRQERWLVPRELYERARTALGWVD